MMRHGKHHQVHAKRRGAALYTLVVFNAFLLGMLGLSALSVARIQRRQSEGGIDIVHAQRLAHSGIKLAKLQLDQNTNWRAEFSDSVLTSELNVGEGTIRFQLSDPIDADLSDEPGDQIQMTSVATYGDAVWSEQITAEPIEGPPEFLKMGLHAGESISIGSSGDVRLYGGPLSTNAELQLNGRLRGNVLCDTFSGLGGHTGSLDTNQAPKALPVAAVISDYQSISTALSYSGPMNGVVLTPTVNTYGGGTNTAGVYSINPGGNTLVLDGVRLQGTLIVDGNARIDNAAFLQSTSGQFATLIVNGDLTVSIDSRTQQLREADYSVNFNPVGAEYEGTSDSDMNDFYPNELQGLIHVRGTFATASAPEFDGCVICEGTAILDGNVEIQHDSSLFVNPPQGYELLPGPKVRFVPGSWQRVAAP